MDPVTRAIILSGLMQVCATLAAAPHIPQVTIQRFRSYLKGFVDPKIGYSTLGISYAESVEVNELIDEVLKGIDKMEVNSESPGDIADVFKLVAPAAT